MRLPSLVGPGAKAAWRHPLYARLRLAARFACTLIVLACSGCAYEVAWLGDEPKPFAAPSPPLGWTVAVGVQSFEAKYVLEPGVTQRFVKELRAARLFESVLYPIPPDLDPTWEMRLLVRETFVDPPSNFWKAVLNGIFFPLRFVLYSDEEYTLDIEAILTRRDEVIGTYAARGPIRYRYQVYAPEVEREAQGVDLILSRTTADIFRQIAADAARLASEDRARAGR
jgi:hypothetical protein